MPRTLRPCHAALPRRSDLLRASFYLLGLCPPSPLNLIGLPYYNEPLLSVWPNELTFAPGDPVARIETIVPLDQVKVIDFVGYAPNPPNRHRNQVREKLPA